MNKLERMRRAVAASKVSLSLREEAPKVVKVPKLLRPGRVSAARRLVGDPHGHGEIDRITSMPLVWPMDEAEVEEFNRASVLQEAFDEGYRLWDVQTDAISSYDLYGGAFCPIGCGFGKTLITQCVTEVAYLKGIKKVLLLVPSSVIDQLVKADFPFARARVPISYPVHVLGGRSMPSRRTLARSGRPGLYILPYSCLSTKDSAEVLRLIAPELIICDEAHKVGNRTSARTKRLFNYIRDNDPQGVCLSGTITDNTIMDYYHLIKWCLKDNCPLPLQGNLATEWSLKLDSKASATGATGPIQPLLEWARRRFPHETIEDDVAGFRRAYMLRLKTTPGVTSTGDKAVGSSLIIHNTSALILPGQELLDLQQGVDDWSTPNGDEIEHALHKFKWRYELTAGFYNELTWPAPQAYAERENVSYTDAEDVLEEAQEYHSIHQLYSKELRLWIQNCGQEGMDTPMLVGHEISTHYDKVVDSALCELWTDLHDAKDSLKNLILKVGAHRGSSLELDKKISASLRDSRVVRVDDYKIQHAVTWAKEHKRGIIWVWHKGIGEWVVEALREANVPVVYCPAGPEHNVAILDPKNQKGLVVASVNAHGTGKNLQAFDNQLYLQWARNAKIAEQSLGRMHRRGQKSAEVYAHTCASQDFDHQCLAATLVDALYIHQTTDNHQRLVYATYTPELPQMFPASVLHERGMQAKRLTPQQQRALSERFGLS